MAEIKLGPISSKLLEPIEIRMKVMKEEIVDVNIKADYAQRNIEKLAQGRNVFNALYLIERVCGICSHAHTTPYCQSVEQILDQAIPEKAKLTRVVVAELERIQSHLLNLFEITHIIGEKNLAMKIFKIKEKVLNTLEIIGGNRVHYGVNIVGGVRSDINNETKQKILRVMEDVKPQIKECYGIIADVRRMKGIGILPKEVARNVAVGPVARASGINCDIRRDFPYAAYDEVGVDVKLRTEGDVMSRVCLRFEETLESVNIVKRALDLLPGHKDQFSELRDIVRGEAVSCVEAPRGANEYIIKLNEAGVIEKLEIKTPTQRNIHVLRDILLGQNVEDSEIILLSTDPCISCACRYIYLK